MFSVLYGNVLLVLYRRKNEDLEDPLTLGPPPKVVSKASNVLTKNAIIVTIVFIVSFTYDLWYVFWHLLYNSFPYSRNLCFFWSLEEEKINCFRFQLLKTLGLIQTDS